MNSESMGQHVLDSNFGFPSLGNIIETPIADILTQKWHIRNTTS